MADNVADLRAAGERIEALLGAERRSFGRARARRGTRSGVVTELYGAGLERLLDILHDAGRLDADVLDALAGDDLVASLLLVHGLHPYDLETRVEQALRVVCGRALRKQGVGVELTAIDADGTVRLRLVARRRRVRLAASVRGGRGVHCGGRAGARRGRVVVVSTGPSVIPVSFACAAGSSGPIMTAVRRLSAAAAHRRPPSRRPARRAVRDVRGAGATPTTGTWSTSHSRALDVHLSRLPPAVQRPRRSSATGPSPTGTSSFPRFRLDRSHWDELQIPVGLAFLSRTPQWSVRWRSTRARPARPSPTCR
jgi:hypothetical protein